MWEDGRRGGTVGKSEMQPKSRVKYSIQFLYVHVCL